MNYKAGSPETHNGRLFKERKNMKIALTNLEEEPIDA